MTIQEINKKLDNPNIDPILKKSLEQKRQILINQIEVNK